MTGFALSIVLLSAVFHATWNLFAKQAGGGVAFVWLSEIVSLVAFAPLVIVLFLLNRPHLGPAEVGMMFGSSLLQLAYFIALLRGYRLGDLSLVYPLARGTGPLLSTFGAILILGERPSVAALAGAAFIAGGAFLLTLGPNALVGRNARQAALYGLLTGVIIGAYTLWDKQAVSAFMIPPLLQYYGAIVAQTLLLLPYIARRPEEITTEWREHRSAVLVVGILSPISYILVLTALTFSLVSYVAPTREISILLGAIMGARLLAEGDGKRRIIASSAMMLGVAALALG